MTFFSAPVIKRNLSKASIFIIAFYLLNTGVGYSQTVTKTLYLSDPGQGLDRSNPSNPVDNTTSTSTVIGQVVTPNAPNGIAQWHQNGTQTPFYRIFNGNSGTYPAAAANSPTVGNNKASVMISAQSPTNNNVAFMAENTNGKSVRLQQWNGSSWSDASFSPLGAAQNLGEIPVAIAFSDNGNAMLVWDNDANDNTIHYRTWNGTTWSAESTFSYAGFGGNNVPITQMRLAAKPGSTEMTLVFFDNDDDSYATVWNGSSWGNGIEISVSADKSTVVNVSYESTGAKKALVVFDNNTTGNFLYRIWNGTAWSSAVTQNFPSGGSNKPEVTSLSSDPNSARILLGLSTSDNQSIFMLWNGTAFSSASQDNLVIASIGRAKNYSPISVAFEGVSGNGLGVTNTSTDNVRYTTWNSSIGWSSITTGPGFGGTPRIIELYPQPGTNKIMVLGNTDQSDIYSSLWNGTSWGTATALELNTGLNGSDGQGKPFTFFWQLATNTTVNTPTTSFTMGTPLCSAITLPAGGAITAEAFLSFSTGTLTDASSYNINAVLKYGATVIATLNPATYSSASGGKLSWSGVIGASPVTVPAGQAITLEITVVSYTAGVSFAILYDSDTKPSKVNLPVAAATAITISSYAVYDAASGGNIINTAIPIGTTAYPRVVVSDPFGFDDITGLSINIPGTGNVEATSTATAGCTRTYQYTWVVSGSPGSVSIPATAREGLEGTVTAVQPLTVTLCTPITTPAFTAPVTNTRCQAGGTLTYTATSTGSVTYTLDATTLAFAGTGAPNSINASTGVVTYASGWTGASTITATATGCAGPKSATFVTTTVGTPVFASGATSTRCIGSAIVTYSATAANGTVTYSLIPSGTGAGQAGTINVNTGAVTYNAVWAGVATITAAPVGCPSNTTVHSATTNAVVAVADVASTLAGAPVEIDVLANDLCDKNPASISIVGQPTSGNIVISNGKITYVPSGNTTYTDVFTYQVCSNTAPGVCSTATVTVSVTAVANDICAESRTPKTFYLPFPESNGQLEKAIKSAGNTIGNTTYTNARSIFSIKINYPGEVVTYDQWEDGYESNILQPTQSTTQVWGDGNLSNGIAPGYPTDIIPAGGYIILDNLIPYRSMDNAASSPNFYYDGRDKVYTTADATIAVIKGDVSIFDVQNVKASVVDITRFGKSFTIPFGEDVSDIDAFKYTSLFIRASQNNTTVQLDYDGNGTIDQTKMLNEGEVWFYDGTASVPGVAGDINNANDIKSGALVTADKPVGVDLVFGGIDNYGTRNVAVLPGEFYGNTYYTPVYKTQSATPGTAPVRVYLTNTSSSPITVTITNNVGSPPSVVIPAKGYVGYTLTAASGYKFASTGGQSFTAVSIQDADNAGSAYDWAFNMIPEERLGTLVSTAWAPGGNPISSSYNYAPVWVTPVAATTFYVKYDGNLTGTGLLGNTPILGLPYDLAISATTLNSYRIVNPSGDNSGLAVFTENNVKFAGAWGEDPERTLNVATPGSSPAQDVGYVLTPKCLSQNIFAGDDFATTPPSTPVNIPILLNDAAFLATINPSSVTTTGYLQPKNGTAVINPDGTLTYTPNFGFTGKDTLVYNVCLLNYPTTCDVATVIITVTACPAGTNQNLISGKVAVDLATANGVVDAGDPAPRSAVKVDLYVDADCSGTVNGTEAVSQTTFSDYLGNYSFATNGKRAADEFATAAYTNNNGNINWTTNWTETIEATNATAGQMQVIADPSANASSLALRFQGNGTTNAYGVSRSLTFSGATTALLSFRFKRQGFDNGSEALLVKLNGTTIYTISNGGVNGTDPNYTIVSLPLSGFLNNGSNTIQFVVNGSNTFTSTEFFYIDGVELAYGPACYIVKVNPTVPGNPYTASTFSAGNTKVLGSTAFGACITAQNLLVTANLVTSNDNATTAVDVPVVISVLANDAIGYPNSSTVATTGAGITLAAAHGTVLVNPDGTIKYTPNPGFTGTDAFQYRVCSLEDPNICDSSTVVVNIACILTPNNYVINGIVYNDANNSASLTSGELGLASQSVKLYIDANNNSLLDGSEGTTALQSTTTNSVGAYTFTIPQTFTAGQYKDPLNVATTSTGSTGATSWTSNPWTKIGEANAFNAGVIRITANGLIINGNGSSTPPVPNNIYGASRTAPNMLPGGTATLKYDYVESGLDNEAGDFVQVQVSADGSTGWVTLFTHIGTDGNQSGTSANLDISAYMSATTTIRFISSGSTGMSTSNQVRFKNVEINYSTANPVKYIVQLGQPITTGYTLTTPSPSPTGYLVSSMTQSSPSSCSQNFGLLGATVAGKLYDDANGLSGSPTNTVDGAGTNVGGTMYVSLVDASNMVLATVAVAPDGYYSFPNVAPGTYNLAIHQTLAGSAIPALPAGYVYTGEYLANSITPVAGTDGTPNGLLTVIVAGNKVGANFGIEQRPTAGSGVNTVTNPAGSAQVPVPANTFTNTLVSSDPSPGTLNTSVGAAAGLKITAFPTGATSIVVNGTTYTVADLAALQALVIPTDANGNPTVTITVDPTADGITQVSIPFVVVDNAGVQSANSGTAVLNFGTTIKGTVYNDVNGLSPIGTDASISTGNSGTNAGGQVYVSLVNSSNVVVATTAVAGDGTYTFSGVTAGTYTTVIHTNAGGSNTPATPIGWVNTGDYLGTGDGNDNSVNPVNGSLTVTVTALPVANANFGIQEIPTSGTFTAANQVNPGGTAFVTVPANYFSGMDFSTGIISSLKITSFPANATAIKIAGVTYTTLAAINAAYPNGIPTNVAGQPTVSISVDPAGGAVSVSIPYKVKDNAGFESSATGAVNLPFTTLNVSGSVFNDVNGLTDNSVNGTGTNIGGALYVSLVDENNIVVGTQPVAADGTYTFTGYDAGNYNIVLHQTPGGSTIPALPAGWVNTGEVCCGNSGDDGSVDGINGITLSAGDVTNVNFGIEQPPIAGSGTNSALNPGGTVQVAVPAGTFTNTTLSSDIAPGNVGSIRITSFPTNTTSITVNGIVYNANIPDEVASLLALVIPSSGSGSPSWVISLDPSFPLSGTSIISFKAIDNAGKESLNTGTATINFDSYVSLQVKVLLEGATIGNGTGFESTMRDNLRVSPFTGANYIPLKDPYTFNSQYNTNFVRVGDGLSTEFQTVTDSAAMFSSRGTASAVDWVFIELRDKTNPATVVATRSAIVERDGTVVEIDGSSCIRFPSLPIGNYYVAVRHRNHLGVMTAAAIPAATLNCSGVVDFTTMTAAQLFNNPGYDGYEMKTLSDGKRALWAGNANGDKKIKYTAPNDDLFRIFTNTLQHPGNTGSDYNFDFGYGYIAGDVDMNSKVKYTAPNDDSFRVFVQLLLYGLNTGSDYNYDFFLEQLP